MNHFPSITKNTLATLLVVLVSSTLSFSQDDDGIYGDIYETPEIEEVMEDTVSPLDGYSTADDYYPEEGYVSEDNGSSQNYSEQYVDENGNNVTNNYYGDYYEDDNDYSYSSRIRRFHNYNSSWGYYDPWYTNMYYYTYDPFFWGTSIYIGYRPSYYSNLNCGFGNTYGYGYGYGGFGWNSPYGGYPACYGGYGYGGINNGYWNGYNNGFNDGLSYGGYYNTYDSNSGIYYGHRGSEGTSGMGLGSGFRSKSFANAYNEAAIDGKVSHANRDNILKTKDGESIDLASLNGFNDRRFVDKTSSGSTSTSTRVKDQNTSTREVQTRSAVASNNPYQRQTAQRSSTSARNPVNVDRNRVRTTTAQPRTYSTNTTRTNTYQRGNTRPAYNAQSQTRTSTYRNSQRSNTNGYNRGNTNGYQQPSRSNSGNSNQYSRPATQQRTNTYRQPTRNATQPTRTTTQPTRTQTPVRTTQPTRSSTPSKGSYTPPARSTGSGTGGRSTSGSTGTRSKGGRP